MPGSDFQLQFQTSFQSCGLPILHQMDNLDITLITTTERGNSSAPTRYPQPYEHTCGETSRVCDIQGPQDSINPRHRAFCPIIEVLSFNASRFPRLITHRRCQCASSIKKRSHQNEELIRCAGGMPNCRCVQTFINQTILELNDDDGKYHPTIITIDHECLAVLQRASVPGL